MVPSTISSSNSDEGREQGQGKRKKIAPECLQPVHARCSPTIQTALPEPGPPTGRRLRSLLGPGSFATLPGAARGPPKVLAILRILW